MARERLTWKQASPPPQMPAVDRTEGPDHPAYYEDPKMDKYEKGNTSTWAEDPKNPMIPESAPPAMPGNLTTEELSHPATSQFERGADKPEKPATVKAASLTSLVEKKAHLCVRIASAIMPGATVAAVQKRALELMDVEEDQLMATAATLNIAAEAPEEEAKMEEKEVEVSKEGSHDLTARLATLESNYGRLVKAMANFFTSADPRRAGTEMDENQLMAYLMGEDRDGDGFDQSKNDAFYAGEEDADEAMLKDMIKEMESGDAVEVTASAAEESVEPLAKGKDIQSGEGGNVDPDAAPKTPQVEGPMKAAGEEEVVEEEAVEEAPAEDVPPWEADKEASLDPMGLMSGGDASFNDAELDQLYQSLMRQGGEEGTEEVVVEEEAAPVEKTASTKKTPRQPQAKTTPKGATPKIASGIVREEMDEMSKLGDLWESKPDVSSYFGNQ